MAFMRFGEGSDVYVFAHIDGGFMCCGCKLLTTRGSFHTNTIDGMLEHLEAHKSVGHQVPRSERLMRLREDA